MMRQRLPRLMFLAGAFLLSIGPPVFAQFGDDPFGGGPAVAPKPAGAAAEAAAPAAGERDPVVLAIRESNPMTPSELTRATQMMMDLNRTDEAKRYLTSLITEAADKDVMIALHREYGSGFFISLSRYKPLAPEGVQFGQQVLETAFQAARDPSYLKTLVQQLSDASLKQRRLAVAELRRADTAAINPLVQALADSNRSSEHAAIREGTAALGQIAVAPLMGVLETPDADLRTHVILVLGRIQARTALPYLLRPYMEEGSSEKLREASQVALLAIIGDVPTRLDAERFLLRRARKYFSGVFPQQPDADGMIEMWRWDDATHASIPRRYPADTAALMEASRAAADLYAIAPNNNSYRQLYLQTKIESEKLVGGLDRPLPRGAGTAYDEAADAGASFVEESLVQALDANHIPAAIGAVEILGDIGTAELLMSDDGRPRALARAMRHGDRRLQLAAVQAVLRLDPQSAYPGSSWLPEVLAYVAKSVGQRRVLIGHPRSQQAQTLVGMLEAFGREGESANTGRRVFERAVADPDVEIILISDAVDFPAASELIQMLRRERKTARIPIGLLARTENLVRLRQFAELDPLTQVFPWPYERHSIAFTIERLEALIGREAITWNTRASQAADALDAFARLAADRKKYHFYDVLREQDAILHALQNPTLSAQAAEVLAVLATPAAQQALVDVASETARPIEERQAAAEAFADAVRLRRLLLTKSSIMQQYRRYNQSETLDIETQNVMASILDTIEGKFNQQDGVAATPDDTN